MNSHFGVAMRTSKGKKQETRERIVRAAAQAFRSRGFGGVGVDGLAEGAEVTSGAFYFHFRSKLDVFTEAIKTGLEELRAGIERLQSQKKHSWLNAFASFYMGFKRTCKLNDACTLPILSAEVERAGDEARAAYEAQLRAIIETIAAALQRNPSLTSREQSWAILALLSGGVSMARTVRDEALSKEIAAAVKKAVALIGDQA